MVMAKWASVMVVDMHRIMGVQAYCIHDLELGEVDRILLYSVDQVRQICLLFLQVFVNLIHNLHLIQTPCDIFGKQTIILRWMLYALASSYSQARV